MKLPDNYQAQSDSRTMMDHHKIKSDPKRHKAAVAHMKNQLAIMKKAMGKSSDTDEPAENS